MTRAIAITLKIPDNAAYTALTALQRLGIDCAVVERSEGIRVRARCRQQLAVASLEEVHNRVNPERRNL